MRVGRDGRRCIAGLAFATLLASSRPSRAEDSASLRCASDDDCAEDGECTYVEEEGCVAASHADCEQAEVCHEHGLCTAREGVCVATSRRDCEVSAACRDGGECHLDRESRECDTGVDRRSKPAFYLGIPTLGVGTANLLLGGLLHLRRHNQGLPAHPLPVGMLIGGGVGLALGITLMAVGGQEATREHRAVGVAFEVRPGEVDLQLRF